MNKAKKQKFITKQLRLLRSFPPNGKGRRKPYLRVKFLNKKKVFFGVFLEKIQRYRVNDCYRRLQITPLLPEIFEQKPLKKEANKYFWEFKLQGVTFLVIVKEMKSERFELLSLYPKNKKTEC